MGKTIDLLERQQNHLMNSNNTHKNSSEWVGAPVAPPLCERKKRGVKETVTPSDRVLRSRSRTKLDEEQATDAKSTTENAIGSVMKSVRDEAKTTRIKNSKAQIGCKTNRKMPSSSQPEIPHRVEQTTISAQPPPSLDGGLGDDLKNAEYCHLTHPSRVSNSTTIDRKMEARINFPASNDKIWCKIDEELEIAIPRVFNQRVINKLTTTELSQKFDSWLHNFFLEKFGKKDFQKNKTNGFARQGRPNKALEHLRKRKRQCKAARKALLKAGLKDSPEEEIIRKEWFSLVRQHNKLRAALAKKELARGKLKAEKAFRADPHKFAAKLFNANQQAGQPAFSADDAQQYFAKTYRDERRDHSYVPLPEFNRPQIPAHLFSLRCPTASEIRKSVRRKRNGAAPGMNALTYVPYKKCAALMKFLINLGHKVWKSQQIGQ